MPRPADQIFLKLAVQQGALSQQDADDVWGELVRLEAEGEPSKARLLCAELGFIDEALGKQLKQQVRSYLERKEQEVHADSKLERRIAGFELMERLGSGAMGVVFKARHLGLNKVVALKVLNPDFAGDERYVARFLQEARVAAALNHAAIVQAYDVGQAGDVHYIAMEFVDGKTVKELIERRGRLGEQAAVEIVLQVLDALKHAHSRSLIHRDIKPANIMITRDGKAKVLDLGLAKRTDIESGLTGEGRAIGTPYFMAPEQALDKGADYRADIYSLGATLFNMVTGDKPYVAGTPVAVMNMHLKAPIPDAHSVCPDVSEGLARIIKKMLAKRPGDRYQDHEPLAKDLEAVLAGLMPELDGGKPPEGIDHIASRPAVQKRPARDREGAASRAPLLVAAAAAACLLGGVALLVRARGQEPAGPVDGPTTEGDAPSGREEAAKVALEEVLRPPPKPGATSPSKRELADDLTHVAQAFPGTQAANDAYAKAQQLLGEVANEEGARFARRKAELEALAVDGKLPDAISGWERLARDVEDGARRAEAEQAAKDLRGRIAALVEAGRRSADEKAQAGQEDEAVRALRRLLPLLPESERELTTARIDELEAAWRKRLADRRRAQETQTQQQDGADAALARTLGPTLRDLFRAGKPEEALAEARRVAEAAKDPALAARAVQHRDALAAALALGDLGRRAFAKLAPETEVTFRRRGGGAMVEGRVVGVTPQGKLQVRMRTQGGAETDVAAEDLEEPDLLRLIRKGLGVTDPGYHLAVASLKLYRGDADAAEAVTRAKELGVDLTGVQEDLARAAPTPAPSDGQVKPDPLAADPRLTNPGGGPGPALTPEQEKERKLAELSRRVSAVRTRLYAEAEFTGGGQAGDAIQLEGLWDFQKLRQFGPVDWRLTEGQTHPAPAGSDRRGLILDGRGRAELASPSSGDLEVSLSFLVTGTLRPESRLALTADGRDARRVTCELGQLVLWQRGKQKGRTGEPRLSELRASQTNLYELRLAREGKRWVARVGGTIAAEIPLDEDLGEVRLGLEWASAPVDVIGLKASVIPASAWLEARLADVERR